MVEKVIEFFETYPGHLKTGKAKLAKRIGCTPQDIDKAKAIIRENEQPAVNDLDEFAKQQGFDPAKASYIWYKGEGLSVAVKSDNKEQLDNQALLNTLQQYDYTPSVVPKAPYQSSNTVSIINMFDMHIDKLNLNDDGGLDGIRRNLDIIFHNFKEILSDVLLDTPSTIIFPIGNDYFNINGSYPATKAGTMQDTVAHWQDVFQIGVDFYRKCIDEMLQYCDVYLPIIPGNHDEDKVFYLGQVLKFAYSNHVLGDEENKLTIDDGKIHYKFVFLNDVLFGLDHGKVGSKKLNNLPSVMATSVPQLWANAKHRVWLMGHVHHKEDYRTKRAFEHGGVDISFLRGATDHDEWHVNNMWVGAKKAISAISYIDGARKITNHELFF